MNIKVLQPTSSDAGTYGGMKEVGWGSVVKAEWISPEMASDPDNPKNGVLVKGSEFIRIGGCTEAFRPDRNYMWGTFEVSE